MFDRLFEVLAQCWHFLLPFCVVDQYQKAVVLRFGKYHRTLEPGIHWAWPCGIEAVIDQQVAWNTSGLLDQSLTTRDGKQVTVSAVLTWRVKNVEKFLLEVMDQDSVLADVAIGMVAQYVLRTDWADLMKAEGLDTLSKDVRKRAFRYGMEVTGVQFANVTQSRSLRLLGMKG